MNCEICPFSKKKRKNDKCLMDENHKQQCKHISCIGTDGRTKNGQGIACSTYSPEMEYFIKLENYQFGKVVSTYYLSKETDLTKIDEYNEKSIRTHAIFTTNREDRMFFSKIDFPMELILRCFRFDFDAANCCYEYMWAPGYKVVDHPENFANWHYHKYGYGFGY